MTVVLASVADSITAEPDANAQEVEIRLLIKYDKTFLPDPLTRWGGTLVPDPP